MFSQAELLPPVPLEFAACVFSVYFAGKKNKENQHSRRGESRAPVQVDVN